MKHNPCSHISPRAIFGAVLALMLAALFAGCARFPSQIIDPNTPPRTVRSEITVQGVINPQYYYFFALDTDNNPVTGPVPIVTGPEYGNGWGTLSNIGPNSEVRQPPFYVELGPDTGGIPIQFRRNPISGQFETLGQPYRYGFSADHKSFWVEIDQRLLVTEGSVVPETVQLNWITDETITIPPQGGVVFKEYDGFGYNGNDYLDQVPLTVSQDWMSGQAGIPVEEPNDSTIIDDIDLIGWSVRVDIRDTPVIP